jgi:DNA-binding GntR family transcriptional regulator
MAAKGQEAAPSPRRSAFQGAALQRQTSAELVAEDIRERILAGDLVPGDPLREAELAAAFGVARNTVREGLRLLTQGGLATHEVHRGVTVRRYTPEEVVAVFDVRAIIEAAAARRAGTVGEDELGPLRSALEDSERAADAADMKGVLTGNLEFHREIVRLLGNPRLDEIFGHLLAEIRLILTSLDRDVAGPWLQRNRELLDLLVSGDPPAFSARLERYLDDARRDVVARLVQLSGPAPVAPRRSGDAG